MELKRVGEIMIPLDAFPQIPYWFTLRQALASMQNAAKNAVKGRHIPHVILVFSAQNLLMGVVGRNEIVRGLRPNFASEPKKDSSVKTNIDVATNIDLFKTFFDEKKAIKRLRSQLERPVVEFMAPIQVTADFDDHLLQIVDLMIERNLIFAPVAQKGQIVGMAYAEDVIRELIAFLYPDQETEKKFYGASD